MGVVVVGVPKAPIWTTGAMLAGMEMPLEREVLVGSPQVG